MSVHSYNAAGIDRPTVETLFSRCFEIPSMYCPECGAFVLDGAALRDHERETHPRTVGEKN